MARIGFLPSLARPAAKVMLCCSAMATSKNFSGYFSANLFIPEPSDIAGVIAIKFLSPVSALLQSHSPNTAEYFVPLGFLFSGSILFRA